MTAYPSQGNMFWQPSSAPLATWSPCKLYRYTLRRTWTNADPSIRRLVTWILLNPSTADETQDDPTIRRCKEFSKLWGFDGLIIVNAYALRSTDPKGLWKVEDPNGPENDAAILGSCREAVRVVCGWGANLRNDRRDALAKMLRDIDLSALKVNANGSPAVGSAAATIHHPRYQCLASRSTARTSKSLDVTSSSATGPSRWTARRSPRASAAMST